MALKDTTKHLKHLLHNVTRDLEKAEGGNKAASQRVRTGTVKMEKIAKMYRKESIKQEKSLPKSAKKKAASKKAAKTKEKAKPKAKAHPTKPRALSFRKASAKLPMRAFR